MKIHRFIGRYDLSGESVEILDLETIKQVRGVLRMEVGNRIVLSDGKGKEAKVTISAILPDKISCSLEALLPLNEPEKKVNLYLAILKKENFELAVQKAVECGVSSITPIITERTVKTGLNMKRLEKIIKEASEQCGRSIVPRINPILDFSPALAFGSAGEEKVIFHPSYSPHTPNHTAKSASIFIGPEGGFTDKELDEARAALYTGASLGDLILRGETASTIATYRTVHNI